MQLAPVSGAGGSRAAERPGILIFWGSPLIFSEWVLRVAAAESGGMQVIRVDDPAAAGIGGPDRRPFPAMVFFDCAHLDAVLRHLEQEGGTALSSRWVLAYRDPAVARRLLTLRARSLVLQEMLLLPMNVPIGTWCQMFRLVLCGELVVPGELLAADDPAPETAGNGAEGPPPCSYGLTRREREVLAHVAEGKLNKVIAHAMGVSEHTVKLHLHHINTKIGARNRTEAAHWYLKRTDTGGA